MTRIEYRLVVGPYQFLMPPVFRDYKKLSRTHYFRDILGRTEYSALHAAVKPE